jgi:ABC-type glycerol-3-phosphate transport system substrate-binding protein
MFSKSSMKRTSTRRRGKTMQTGPRHLILVFCWLLVVGACTEDGTSTSSPTATSAAELEGELTIWNFDLTGGARERAIHELDRRFMELHPAVEINHVGLGYGNLLTKARAMIAAQRGPDIISLYPGAFAADYRQGLIPLDE